MTYARGCPGGRGCGGPELVLSGRRGEGGTHLRVHRSEGGSGRPPGESEEQPGAGTGRARRWRTGRWRSGHSPLGLLNRLRPARLARQPTPGPTAPHAPSALPLPGLAPPRTCLPRPPAPHPQAGGFRPGCPTCALALAAGPPPPATRPTHPQTLLLLPESADAPLGRPRPNGTSTSGAPTGWVTGSER